MAVNWFEGARRISQLAIGIVCAAGAAFVIFRNEPNPILSTRGPTMPWFVSPDPCPEQALVRELWDYDWGGTKPGLRLCFLPVSDNKIPYKVAPTPPEELKRREKQNEDDLKRLERGEFVLPELPTPWFFVGKKYDERVLAYVSESMDTLKVAPDLTKRLEESRSAVRWADRKSAFNEALPWVAGISAFIWFFTLAAGWIVRGFAGIPIGADFRAINKQDQSTGL